eukprot:scaffold132665_cov79-Attheya_sp.AAC.1
MDPRFTLSRGRGGGQPAGQPGDFTTIPPTLCSSQEPNGVNPCVKAQGESFLCQAVLGVHAQGTLYISMVERGFFSTSPFAVRQSSHNFNSSNRLPEQFGIFQGAAIAR